jgi:hypothetical protein
MWGLGATAGYLTPNFGIPTQLLRTLTMILPNKGRCNSPLNLIGDLHS